MGYIILVIAALLVAALIAFFAVRLLINLRWIPGFIRGSVGLALLALAGAIGICAADLSSYHELANDKQIATISFVKQDAQYFAVTVVDSAGTQARADVYGDLWQASIRIVNWSGPLQMTGLKPGYRLDQIKGRYYTLEQERKAKREEPLLVKSRYGIDLWKGIYDNSYFVPGIDASYNNAAFLPMADGALFEIRQTDKGLLAKPLNEPAQHAVADWQ